jgi:integrase
MNIRIIQGKKKADGTRLLSIRSPRGQRSTGIYVVDGTFITAKQRCKQQFKQLNELLSKLVHEERAKCWGERLDGPEVKYGTPSSEWSKWKRSKAHQVSLGRWKHYAQLEQYIDWPSTVNQLTDQWFHECLSNMSRLASSTVGKHVSILKAFCGSLGIDTSNWQYKVFEAPKESLTAEEYAEVIELSRNGSKALKAFVVACETGLRFSSLQTLFSTGLSSGEFTKVFVSKTGKDVIVPHTPLVKEYMPVLEGFMLNNQVHNRQLKTELSTLNRLITTSQKRGGDIVSMQSPLHSNISFHTARRTFATLATLKGIPEAAIMRVGGWTTSKMLRKYQKLSDVNAAKFFSYEQEDSPSKPEVPKT